MRLTKTLLMTALVAVAGSQAIAGGFAPVVTEPEPVVVVEPEAPRSTLGILLPLALGGALIAVALSQNDDSEDETVTADE